MNYDVNMMRPIHWVVLTFFILLVGSWMLFKDTMNRIQYLERPRIYWIARDVGGKGDPFFCRATMRTTDAPYWRGTGWQFRIGTFTFQVGRLRMKVDSLDAQLSDHPWVVAGLKPKDLRQW